MRTTESEASIPERWSDEADAAYVAAPHLPQRDAAESEFRSEPDRLFDTNTAGGAEQTLDLPITWQEHTVQPGDSLYLVLDRLGISPQVVSAVTGAAGSTRPLRELRPGQVLRVQVEDGVVAALEYQIDPLRLFQIQATDGGYIATTTEKSVERRTAQAFGSIDSSLYLAGQTAGLSDRIILELAEIFGWDIDFTLDLRHGDHFSVVYDSVYADGIKVADGDIQAAEFINKGRVLRAVRFTDENGRPAYYTPAGKSLRKAFNRNPLPVMRITSPFNPNRLHPLFGTRRPHKGVDYGAPTGTPVRATGDGTVAFAGIKGGYGKVVILQHGKSYRTLYGHLSRFARSTQSGARVRQGDVVAYVGMTGWATGPHLHYEFQVNGVQRDPYSTALPVIEPLPPSRMAEFRATTGPLLVALDAVSGGSVTVGRGP